MNLKSCWDTSKSIRKDAERAFAVLQACFTIIRGTARPMEKADMGLIMNACVILHNMIIKGERDSYGLVYDYEVEEGNMPESNSMGSSSVLRNLPS